MSKCNAGISKLTAKYIEDGTSVLFSTVARLYIACRSREEAEDLLQFVSYKGYLKEYANGQFGAYWMGLSILKVADKMNLDIDHPKIHQLLIFQVMHS